MTMLIQDLSASLGLMQLAQDPIFIGSEVVPRGTPGSASEGTVGDSTFAETTDTTTWSDYLLTEGYLEESLTVENLNPEIATLDGSLLTRITDGTCRIRVSRTGASRTAAFNCYQHPGSTLSVWTGYTPGSLADLLADNVLSLLDDGDSARYYSTANHDTSTYTRNPACWAAGLDLSGVSVAGNPSGSMVRRFPATLIDDGTRRHVIGATHANMKSGKTFRFVNPAGEVFTRTTIGQAYCGDLTVCTLDEALPASIAPLKIAGDWIQGVTEPVADAVRYNFAGIAFHIDQHTDCWFVALGGLEGVTASVPVARTIDGDPVTVYDKATCMSGSSIFQLDELPEFLTGKTELLRPAQPGDSGSPLMVIVDDEPALLWTWWGVNLGPPLWQDGVMAGLIADSDTNAGVSTSPTVVYATDPTA